MNHKNRKTKFATLTKNAKDIKLISKLARDVQRELMLENEAPEILSGIKPEMSSTDLDAEAKEYTKKLFLKMWESLPIDLIDVKIID